MIKFIANTFFADTITKVKVVRETAKFVFFGDGSRQAKLSNDINYFDTREEAKEHIIKHIRAEADAIRKQTDKLAVRVERAYKL